MSTLTQSIPSSAAAARTLAPFYLGAAADIVVGLELALFGPDVAQIMMPSLGSLLGADPGTVMRVLGVVLLVFAVDTILIARSKGRLARLRPWIARANLGSAALAGLLLAAYPAFSTVGVAAVAVIAVALGVIGLWQHKAA
jgi:hypothetical protein